MQPATDTIESKVLALLKRNARIPVQEMADRLNATAAEVEAVIARLEKERVILGYKPILAAECDNADEVRAIIEVQVQPERDTGFDQIARRLGRFSEVIAVYLVSGHYDLHLEVVGRSLQEVALFVAKKLATQDGVKSCQTLFLLKKYKEAGITVEKEEHYERLKVTP